MAERPYWKRKRPKRRPFHVRFVPEVLGGPLPPIALRGEARLYLLRSRTIVKGRTPSSDRLAVQVIGVVVLAGLVLGGIFSLSQGPYCCDMVIFSGLGVVLLGAVGWMLIRPRMSNEARFVADPKSASAMYDPGTRTVFLEFDDEWGAFRLTGRSAGREGRLLGRLKACYGARLIVDSGDGLRPPPPRAACARRRTG